MKRSVFAFSVVLILASTSKPSISATLHVWQYSPNPGPPYSSWATAAHVIQEAVDAALEGDEILVTNGVYQTGARSVYGMSNRVAVMTPVTVRSASGPEVTHIVGYQVPETKNGPAAVRCVYLTNGAVLAGFTLTKGATQTNDFFDHDEKTSNGGGVWCEGLSAVVSNCTVTGNSAGSNGDGGGAFQGTLSNCTLTDNSAKCGGGAFAAMLKNLRSRAIQLPSVAGPTVAR